MKWQVNIPVRPLVEYVYRSGSIDTGFRTATSLTEGTKAHRKIQQTYGEDDQSEVFLRGELLYEDILFVIEGRCDGLLLADGEVTVDEIKSTSGDIESITEHSYPVHWAQAKCYAYMYVKEHESSQMNVQLTYVQKETNETKRFKREYSFAELTEFMSLVLKEYSPYAKWEIEHEQSRNSSIKKLTFPYESYRKGQRQLAASVYKTILDGKNIFASAPTGIGKTISTLFPAVKAIGEGIAGKIFYLTARTTIRQTAEEALQLMNQSGLEFKSVTITAKDKICFTEEKICSKEHCPFADGFYDRVNEAVLDILTHENELTRTVIEAYARKHQVCPFEYSLELAYAVDAVICDYNYIFDPRISLKRNLDAKKKETVLLVDEAHNLVDRARDMYSASLEKKMFLELKRGYKNKNKAIFEAADAINRYFIQLRKQAGDERFVVWTDRLAEMDSLVERFITAAEQELANGTASDEGEPLLDAYFAVLGWVRISNLYDERFVTYLEVGRNQAVVKMFCLDPSNLLQKTTHSFKSAVYFSATLSPIEYFMDMLGGTEEDFAVSIPAPFAKEQFDVRMISLSTRYHDRDKSILPIVQMIESTVKAKPGNYFVFFPSYQYMNAVHDEWAVSPATDHVQTIIQTPGMAEEDRTAFLEKFTPRPVKPVVGFAIMGGIFSEGVDLKGERLNGVMIVGVGLPQISAERDLIKQHFSSMGKNGYDYAYVYPGMNKVLQAGGRLIRSEKDTGVIVLIDDRFFQSKYQKLMPFEWH